ncbi:unnamed protein product [Lepeophtheirus salmonis]|uniref:Seipin n=1 Tax=Lepeophtheirus salmonis TaxID=72036 RepID=A0A7R8CRF8_LEPSM|nr:unnamed protein product [Lepeophtheirus salmonis]CAF2904816.1 unnamed protein product [Lepeophtheirus salmonis]
MQKNINYSAFNDPFLLKGDVLNESIHSKVRHSNLPDKREDYVHPFLFITLFLITTKHCDICISVMQRIRNVHSGLSSRIISAKQFPARTKDKIGSAALMTWDLCYNCFTIAISMIPCHSSPSKFNRDHGMFMSCLKVFGKNGSMLREHCKSSLFPHRSFITRQLRNLIISPGVIAGYWNEYETIEIDFFKEFMDMDPYNPAKWITFVIKSRFLDVYSAELRILADFKVLISVLVISWLHLHGENYIKKGFEDSVDDMDDTSEDSMDSEKPEIEDLYNSNLDFSRKNWFFNTI